MSLAEVDALPAAEVNLWREYHQRYGWPSERVMWTQALVGANLCGAWGSKKMPRDFVPRFMTRSEELKEIASRLANLPGAKVRKRPKKVKDGG